MSKSNNYLNNENISDVVYNYIVFRKKENELVNIIQAIVKHFQLMPKFSGYPKSVLDDMMQVSLFNFFNNIHDIKFSRKKIGKVIKIKNLKFFTNYEKDSTLISKCSKQMYIKDLTENRKGLLCYEVIEKFDITDIEKYNNYIKQNKTIKKINVRMNATDFKEYYVAIHDSELIEVPYRFIDFNYFSFITETVKKSFYQVLNGENNIKEAAQVILWAKTDAYKFDVNDQSVQENIVNTIREVNKNFEKKRAR